MDLRTIAQVVLATIGTLAGFRHLPCIDVVNIAVWSVRLWTGRAVIL
jgi:hypothetical protein